MNTEVSIRFAAEDSALAVATKRVASIDHPDPTNPSYKLLPDSVATQLTLSRPHLKEAEATEDGAGGVVVDGKAPGYPVFQGLHFCGGGLTGKISVKPDARMCLSVCLSVCLP